MHLDIYCEIIDNIKADLKSPARTSRMLEGSVSQRTVYREVLQWLATQLNRTRDGIQTATANMAGAREEDQWGFVQTKQRISEVEAEFMLVLPQSYLRKNSLRTLRFYFTLCT
jgi:hypothetical protein